MIRNVGWIDRLLRLSLAIVLVFLGLIVFEGIDGNLLGILLAIAALFPTYMVVTGSCFVFRWFRIHSLSKKECSTLGHPYKK